jgi:hypothetical protein
MNDKIKILLAEMKERREKYSKRAALCDKLALVLYISAIAFLLLGAVVYFSGYDHRPPLAISLTLSLAGYAAYILYTIYSDKAAKAARQVCILECMLEQKKREDTSQQSIHDTL